jgi:riboflavin kinase/FMN adenylyltransferase
MEVIRKAKDFNRSFKNPVLTIGNFDGVHRGHQRIFQRVREHAQKIGGESIAYTFDPHPVELFNPEKDPFLLIPVEERLRLIGDLGIQVLICAPFTRQFANLRAEEFVRDILFRQIGVRKIFVGQNTSFGRGREGNAALLKEFGQQMGFDVEIVEAVEIGGATVSSSRIRTLIRQGDMEGAAELLGRYPFLVGEVVQGHGRGAKKLGFPTANLKVSRVLVPSPGIYACWAVLEGRRYPAVADLGWNPTFQDQKFSIEVHILNFTQDIYGRTLSVEFVRRLRDEVAFSGPEELVAQIKKDILLAKEILRVG